MVIIGSVELPSDFVTQRLTDRIANVIGTVQVDKDYDTAFHQTNSLPRVRFSGFMQTSDAVAITKLDALTEMFNNPDMTYPLYINIDEEFYFVLNSFRYDKTEGYKRYWRFELEVVWIGDRSILKNIYLCENYSKEDNDWGL